MNIFVRLAQLRVCFFFQDSSEAFYCVTLLFFFFSADLNIIWSV